MSPRLRIVTPWVHFQLLKTIRVWEQCWSYFNLAERNGDGENCMRCVVIMCPLHNILLACFNKRRDIIIIIIIINIEYWTLWSVPSPKLQLLSPTFLRSSNCSPSLWSVVVWFQRDPILWHSLRQMRYLAHPHDDDECKKYYVLRVNR